MKIRFLIVAALFAASPAFANNNDVTCIAKGKASQLGTALLTNSKIQFKFYYNRQTKLSEMRNITGTIKVAYDWEENLTPDTLNDDNAYVGHFNIAKLVNNPKYNPRRYKNYMQFQKMNTNDTTGSESGMWGNFVVEKSIFSQWKFQAHYIFQAGDHMGGVIHFTCKLD